jgi:DNA polymerase-3 subunit epsilon
VIVVDVETTGLQRRHDLVVEVAWWNLTTAERGHFIPAHDIDHALDIGSSVALKMNDYQERIMVLPQDLEGIEAQQLETQLKNNTLAGSNPSFDAAFLERIIFPSWHHRLWDLGAYAAGRLNLNYIPGLADVCSRLGVNAPDHTAVNDVTATGTCLLELASRP